MTRTPSPAPHRHVASVRSMLNGRSPGTSRVAQDLAEARRENTLLRRENRELKRRLEAATRAGA